MLEVESLVFDDYLIFRSERNWPNDSSLKGLENNGTSDLEKPQGKGVKETMFYFKHSV